MDVMVPNASVFPSIEEYWTVVMNIKTESGNMKYDSLSKVVKSMLSLQNGNSDVERSLSDNRNTLSAERTNLSDETLIGIRRLKEHARHNGGASNVEADSKEVILSVQRAHSKYKERKRQEEEERKMKELQKQRLAEAEKKREEIIEKAEKKKDSLDKAEEALYKDESSVEEKINVEHRLLNDATKSLNVAIEVNDMVGVEAANEMIQITKQNMEKFNCERTEQLKLRAKIGQKRKITLDKFVTKIKRA